MIKSDFVTVAVSIAAGGPYTYHRPVEMAIRIGSVVCVPVRNRFATGVVWGETSFAGDAAYKIKDIQSVYQLPPLSSDMLAFIDWVSRYNMVDIGMVLRMCLPGYVIKASTPTAKQLKLINKQYKPNNDSRQRVIELFSLKPTWLRSELKKTAKVSHSLITNMIKDKVLALYTANAEDEAKLETQKSSPVSTTLTGQQPINFSDEQTAAINKLSPVVINPVFKVNLLYGVTGSGKTAIYFDLVAQALKRKRQCLIMLPEIALTTSFSDRFQQHFNQKPTLWHSGMTPKQRAATWRAILNDKIKVVVGARSALFLPFKSLGLIVIDEEHDSSYKQADRVIYNARDMAIVRANIESIPVILCSATPSIETIANVETGKYTEVRLQKRYSGVSLPAVNIIDMSAQGSGANSWLSSKAIAAINQTLARKKQALIFLNRRGYAPLTLCRKCGHSFSCPNCSAWLVEHKSTGKLNCHHCGYAIAKPQQCPECGSKSELAACGPGVERVFEQASELWPQASMTILSSDHLSDINRLNEQLKAIIAGKVDLIIGTQMIAKGHHFPNLTTIVVVDADAGLDNADLRAGERCFQLLTQVSGRAGREHIPGQVWLQSYKTDHPLIKALASGNAEAFYNTEIAIRRRALFPPFGRMIALIISASKPQTAHDYAKKLADNIMPQANIKVLGPVEAPMAFIRRRYRLRFLVRGERNARLQSYVSAWLARCGASPARVQIDVDPVNFL